MSVQNDMLTIAGEAQSRNGTHPNRSRKRSPVRNCRVRDLSRRVAGYADSQNFACARHVRNSLLYQLTFRFVVILRLRFGESGVEPPAHATTPHHPSRIGLYACTGMADQPVDLVVGIRKDRSKSGFRIRIRRVSGIRARIVQRTNNVRSRKYSPGAQLVASSRYSHMPDTRGVSRVGLPKMLTLIKNPALQRMSNRFPKSLTVTFAVSKNSIASSTYAHPWVRLRSAAAPEKPHLSTATVRETTR